MQHRFSTRLAAMLQNKLYLFCCPFYRSFTYLVLWLTEKSPLVPLYPETNKRSNKTNHDLLPAFIGYTKFLPLTQPYHVRHIHTMPLGSCVRTKTIPDRDRVHTQEWWFRRDFYNGAKLHRADLKNGASHIGYVLCHTLVQCEQVFAL